MAGSIAFFPSIMGAMAGVGGAGAASQYPGKEAAVEQNSSIKENVGKYNKDAILNKWFSSQTLKC
jgi:hypothetical protein